MAWAVKAMRVRSCRGSWVAHTCSAQGPAPVAARRAQAQLERIQNLNRYGDGGDEQSGNMQLFFSAMVTFVDALDEHFKLNAQDADFIDYWWRMLDKQFV